MHTTELWLGRHEGETISVRTKGRPFFNRDSVDKPIFAKSNNLLAHPLVGKTYIFVVIFILFWI